MHPPFEFIRFGPFVAEYHRMNVNQDFVEALQCYLEATLLPQVTIEYESVIGGVTASYDNDRNCGPNSAIKNLYKVEISFSKGSLVEDLKAELNYSPISRRFSVRNNGPLYLWSVARKIRDQELRRSIDVLCREIDHEGRSDADCPCCGVALRIINTPGLFDVVCPRACFKYNFHRDPNTGQFEHGHFFMRPPTMGVHSE